MPRSGDLGVIRQSMRTIAQRITFAVFAFCIGGCGPTIDRDDFAYITYGQYVSVVGTDYFNPVGAASISHKLDFQTDGYDRWYKIKLPEGDYQELLGVVAQELADPQRAAYMARPIGSVDFEPESSPELPANWPRVSGAVPEWWSAPIAGQLLCSRWQLQCETRAKGWHWIYDRKHEQLWIWQWNYQHWRL